MAAQHIECDIVFEGRGNSPHLLYLCTSIEQSGRIHTRQTLGVKEWGKSEERPDHSLYILPCHSNSDSLMLTDNMNSLDNMIK